VALSRQPGIDAHRSPRRDSLSDLPPGQQRIRGFPRFGAHLDRTAPLVPVTAVIEIAAGHTCVWELPVADLAVLPRQQVTADFHCVAGWTATGLTWDGVPFSELYRRFVADGIAGQRPITHVLFAGRDGYSAVVALEDALEPEVLIADRLDGEPLGADHGAPARLVSPQQYGYMSTKHLRRIEFHSQRPRPNYGQLPLVSRVAFATGLKLHPRARVWREERHPALPSWIVRPLYQSIRRPIGFATSLGESLRRARTNTNLET
jgi:hypothetical protein